MESNQSASFLVTGDKKKSSRTPRELIKYHIENPEEPITDEDLRNLNLQRERVVDFVVDEFSRSGE